MGAATGFFLFGEAVLACAAKGAAGAALGALYAEGFAGACAAMIILGTRR